MPQTTVDHVYRDYNTDGVPASGDHEPDKAEIRALLKQIMNSGGLAVTRNTYAALAAVTPPTENYMGVVLNDPDPTKNGYYARVSAAWVWQRGFPDTFARVDLAGTGTTQTGTLSSGVNPSDIVVFFALVETTNTGPMTLSIAGEIARDVVNASGAALSAGEWVGGAMFFLNESGDYQLINDAGAAAAAAASAALAQTWAEAAAEIAIPDAFTLATTAAVADLAGLRALDTTRYVSAELYGTTGLAGHFSWVGSDLSATMVNRTVTSTSFDAGTDVITSAAHQLDTGNVVIATTTVSGLALQTHYYVSRIDADTFKLYDTYANAMAGGATGRVDLTGATNFTVKRLSDPLGGVYVVPTGLSLDGSNGAWVRRHNKTLDIRWFRAVGDGVTDDRQAIMAAFECASAINGSVHAPGGTWAFNGEIYVYRLTPLFTDGADKTIFKNLSATGNGLYFERHGAYGIAPGTLNTSLIAVAGGFTLDQNGSTGHGLTLRAQYTTLTGQVIIKNQGATGYALNLDGINTTFIEYVSLFACKNGVRAHTAYYSKIGKLTAEVTAGLALDLQFSTSLHFDDCYLDPGSTADPRQYLANIQNCVDVTFNKLHMEIDNSGTYSGLGVIFVTGCSGFIVQAGRALIGANAYSALNNKAFIYLSAANSNIDVQNYQMNIAGGTFTHYFMRAGASADNQISLVTLRNIITDINTSGSRYLFYNDTYLAKNLSISQILDIGSATQVQFRATNVLFSQYAGNITNEAAADSNGVSTTMINCNGTKTGLSGATRVNSTA